MWTARAFDEDRVFDAGTRVQVVEIRGATALVDRVTKEDRTMAGSSSLAVLLLFALFVAAKTVRIIPQASAGVVERLGRYSRTLDPGLAIIIPFVDRVRPLIDLREQVVSFPPQPVITQDNVRSRSTPSSTSRSPTRRRPPTRSPTRCRRSSSSP